MGKKYQVKMLWILLLLFFSNSLIGRYKEPPLEVKDIDKKLFEAVDKENKNTIKDLISEGANINAYTYYQNCDQTPIHLALHNKSLGIAELLLSLGADIYSTDEFGETPLHYCKTNEYLNFAEKLISLGANVNVQRQAGMTPLHTSAGKKDSVDIIKLLIKNNADIYLKDIFGCSTFVYSIDNAEVLKYFLNLNIDINIPLIANLSMLHMAVFNKNEESTKLLIKHNANVNHKALFGITPVFLAIAKIIDPKIVKHIISDSTIDNENNYKDEQSSKNINKPKITQLKIVELLLKSGANVYEKMQSINEFLNKNSKLKQDIEKTCNDFQPKCPQPEFNIVNNKLGFNDFHSFIIQYVITKKILKYEKDDLEINREKIICGYRDLNFTLDFLIKNYKDMDLAEYSAYELIKKNYSTFIELVEKEDKNKELIYLRKLLNDICIEQNHEEKQTILDKMNTSIDEFNQKVETSVEKLTNLINNPQI